MPVFSPIFDFPEPTYRRLRDRRRIGRAWARLRSALRRENRQINDRAGMHPDVKAYLREIEGAR